MRKSPSLTCNSRGGGGSKGGSGGKTKKINQKKRWGYRQYGGVDRQRWQEGEGLQEQNDNVNVGDADAATVAEFDNATADVSATNADADGCDGETSGD